jgi:hypothetical protein
MLVKALIDTALLALIRLTRREVPSQTEEGQAAIGDLPEGKVLQVIAALSEL